MTSRVSSGARRVCDRAVDMIVAFEALHRVGSDGMIYPYHDAVGYPTIGIGHLLSRVKWEPLDKYPPITRQEALDLHHRDLDKFARGVQALLKVWVTDEQFGAMVSFAFNVGLGNLQSSTLLKRVNRNDDPDEIAREFLKWNKAGGVILRGLTRRRRAEADLFLGIYGNK